MISVYLLLDYRLASATVARPLGTAVPNGATLSDALPALAGSVRKCRTYIRSLRTHVPNLSVYIPSLRTELRMAPVGGGDATGHQPVMAVLMAAMGVSLSPRQARSRPSRGWRS